MKVAKDRGSTSWFNRDSKGIPESRHGRDCQECPQRSARAAARHALLCGAVVNVGSSPTLTTALRVAVKRPKAHCSMTERERSELCN